MKETSEDTIDFAGVTGHFDLPLRPLPPMYGNDVLNRDPYEDVFGNKLPQFGHSLNIIPGEIYRTPDTYSEARIQPSSLRELILTDKRTCSYGAPEDPALQNLAESDPAILSESQISVSSATETVATKTPYNPWQTIRSIGKKAASTIVEAIDTVRGVSERLSENPKLRVAGYLGSVGTAAAGVILACEGVSILTSKVRGTTFANMYIDGAGNSVPLSPAIEDTHHHVLDNIMPDVSNYFQTTFFDPNWRLLFWYAVAPAIFAAIPTAITAIYLHNKHQDQLET